MNIIDVLSLFNMDIHSLSAESTGVVLALMSAVCWAVGSSVYKKGLEGIDPWSGNLVRTGCAALGFLFIVVVKGTVSVLPSITLHLLWWLIFSAFFAFFLGDLLFLTSLKRIGVSRTVPVSSTYPLFVTVWAFIVYKRPVSLFIVVGTLFIVVAIKLISGEGDKNTNTGTVKSKDEDKSKLDEREDTQNTNHSKGVLLALLAAVCWSISVIVLDYLLLFLPTEAVAVVRFFITFLLTAAVVSTQTFTFNKNALLWIGIGGTALLVISNYMFLEAIKLASSTKVAPISAVYPVISVFLAAIFLKEKLTRRVIGGTLMSFLGIFLVTLG